MIPTLQLGQFGIGRTMDVSVNHALYIYNKLADWWTCQTVAQTQYGDHASTLSSGLSGTGGSVSSVSGKHGNAIDYTPRYVHRVATASLPFTPASSAVYSMGAWINADSLSGTDKSLLSLAEGNNQNGRDRILQALVTSTGVATARAGNDTSTFWDASTSAGTVTTGSWYFVQAERGTNYVRVRINNGSWVQTSITSNTASTTGITFTWGGDYNSSSAAFINDFNGNVDEVFICANVLSNDEWDYLYNGGSGRSYAELRSDAGINYSHFNPSDRAVGTALSSNNKIITAATATTDQVNSVATQSSGAWRVQFVVVDFVNPLGVGFTSAAASSNGGSLGAAATGWGLWGNYSGDLRVVNNGSHTTYSGLTLATSDVIDLLIDIDAGKAWLRQNGTVISGDPVAGTGAMMTFTPGTPIFLAADAYALNGDIRLRTDPAEITGSSVSGFTDGWPD